MNKAAITQALRKNYDSFINYISSLSEDDFLLRYKQKWTAGQQVAHLLSGIKALARVFDMNTEEIEQHFGAAVGVSRSYLEVKEAYDMQLATGGKAPERFLPEAVGLEQKTILLENLTSLIHDLCAKIDNFAEAELDGFYIPHPLLGNLTMREMLFNAIYHVEHHHQLTEHYLQLSSNNA